jgi:endonuclease YncB( thermonuclease family)
VALSLLFVWAGAVLGETFSGKVVRITDGDTITVLRNREPVKVRLLGIDSPERGQPFGQEARRRASRLAFGKMVTVSYSKKDRWGRVLGEVTLPGGKVLNQEMVRSGYAWHYKKYSDDTELARLEDEARSLRLGLWRQVNPVPPWEFRKAKRLTQAPGHRK